MRSNLDRWRDLFARQTIAGTSDLENGLGANREEMASRVLEKAQEYVSRFTVVISKTGSVNTDQRAQDIVRGSGVIVKLGDGRCGVLTAAHVLKFGANTRNRAAATLLAVTRERTDQVKDEFIELSPRPCVTEGFNNESESGPDIAFIPITSQERSNLERWGMVAYDLEKERWSEEVTARFGKITLLISVIHGVRCAASEIVESHAAGENGSLALMATSTEVSTIHERNGHHYLELPSETNEESHPTHWKDELPGTAAEEIEELHDTGVTRKVWGGTSGAGVWNVAIEACDDGVPDGKVAAALAGICFFADPSKGCIVAHSLKSIAQITSSEAVAN